MYKKDFLPESMYELDSKITRDTLLTGQTVTGKVMLIRTKTNRLLIDLGNGLEGFMSVDDATIYPTYNSDGSFVSVNIYTLVGKIIRAKIISLEDGIQLSRKENMLEALETLKNQTEFQNVSITSFSKFSAFVDVGAGITGRVWAKDFAPIKFYDIRDVGLIEGDIFSTKNLGFDESLKSFNLSRTEMFPKTEEILAERDIVKCKVFEGIEDNTGYFVLINETICGLLDSPFPLNYGDTVIGIVKKITPKGPKLNFLSN